MKLLASLASATVTGAFVLPDPSVFGDIAATSGNVVDFLTSEVADALHTVEDAIKIKDELEYVFELESSQGDEPARFPEVDLQEHDYSDFTIYELISKSNHATNFSKLVDRHEDIVKLLNDSDALLTLFVPIDEAFEHIPDEHKEPASDEFVKNVLNYHIGDGVYPAKRILGTHTLPTKYHEAWLGGEAQRLRTSVGLLSGVRVNVYSKVVAADFKAKNGYIHAVSKILVPPPMIGREISLFPGQFSTLLLAYEKTNFVGFIHNVKMIGSTVFAPSNQAWTRLGPKANAFLFNTEHGKKYLTALLKYQIVANTTVYSDKIYYGDGEDEELPQASNDGHTHLELHTLLEGKPLGLDIHSWKGFVSLVVNGYVKVGFKDVIGKNGVVQVVESVPIPPHKHGEHAEYLGGEIDVDDLKERIDEYLDAEDQVYDEWFSEL